MNFFEIVLLLVIAILGTLCWLQKELIKSLKDELKLVRGDPFEVTNATLDDIERFKQLKRCADGAIVRQERKQNGNTDV